MRQIVIDKKGSRLDYERSLLFIHHDNFKKPISVPFEQIQSLVITTYVSIGSSLLTKLASHKIAVVILPSRNSGEACFIQGKWHNATMRRCEQYQIINDERRIYWAKKLVKLKIRNQYHLLDKLRQQTQENDKEVIQAIGDLQNFCRRLSNEAQKEYDLDSLRGIEGAAAVIFFGQYKKFFDSELGFVSRNRRPPKDPVNALLSLGYTLLQGIYEQAVYAVGFDPYLGVLHEISYGRASLACDFTELGRADIEYWVWQLFNQEIIEQEDFGYDNSRFGCELLKEGRSRFYESFSKLRFRLQKNALKQVWLWQKRLLLTDEQDDLMFVFDETAQGVIDETV